MRDYVKFTSTWTIHSIQTKDYVDFLEFRVVLTSLFSNNKVAYLRVPHPVDFRYILRELYKECEKEVSPKPIVSPITTAQKIKAQPFF